MSSISVTIIQTALYWEDKPANLQMFSEKISGITEKTAIVVLPEMFTTGFSMNTGRLAEDMDGETISWMKKKSAEKGVILTGSMIAKEKNAADNIFFNRLIWMLPNGDFGIYDKRHLFAYGNEDQHYTSGKKRLIASVNGWKINLQVCYDLRFPLWIRQSKLPDSPLGPEFDILIIVANWPSARSHAWKTLLQARAIENQCYVIGVNRVGTDGRGLDYAGESMIVGPAGDIIKILGDKEEIFSYSLDRERLEDFRTKYPFWKDADRFLIQP
jgi:omega-amidase